MGTKRAASHTTRRKPRRQRIQYVHQFLIALSNTDPLVWRRIQVPEDYSFWDLHVAIQDSLGWQDYHLHEFTVLHPDREQLERIGIPDEDFPEERPCVPSWQVRVSEYFAEGRPPALYVYDFGDDWQHVLMYEGAWPADPSVAYPRCVGGRVRVRPRIAAAFTDMPTSWRPSPTPGTLNMWNCFSGPVGASIPTPLSQRKSCLTIRSRGGSGHSKSSAV